MSDNPQDQTTTPSAETTPSGETSSPTESTPSSEEPNELWAEIADAAEEAGFEREAELTPEEPQQQEQTDATPASETPASPQETAPAAPEPEKPQEPQTPQEPQEPAAQTPQPEQADAAPTPEQAQEAPQPPSPEVIAKARTDYVDDLMKSKYAMDDTAVQEFESNPGTYIPNALANLHANIVQESIGLILNRLPGLIRDQLGAIKVEEKHESGFFEKWPALKDPKYMSDVKKAGMAFRQLNPQASVEEFYRAVGLQVSIMHGLPLDTVVKPAGSDTPQEESVGGNGQAPTPRDFQQGFQPAAPGSGSGQMTPEQENAWSELSREFDSL